MPSRTPFKTNRAAGIQREQLRFSCTHWETGTGTSEHGARSSLTYVLHSFFSRGVSMLVSTPLSVTSAWVVVVSFEASPPAPPAADCPRHVEPSLARANRKIALAAFKPVMRARELSRRGAATPWLGAE